MSKIKLLSFDLDDTLWETAPTIARAEQAFYQHLGTAAPALVAKFSPEALRAHRLQYLRANPNLQHHISQWRIDSLNQALIESGYQEQSRALATAAFDVFYQARQQVELFEHCAKILAELSKDFLLISLTNGNADLTRLPISQHFHASFRAEQVGAAKPAPALFLAALTQANCRPEECIHIGDNTNDDISGAKAVGMYAIQARLTASAPEPHPLADQHFDDWRELPRLIQQIHAG
ncbi:HAD family hydrolase [Zhongshania sp.]|uniref:HAD family hydrolase n=1 Tax=Zhongshania sp. TaxID=1971902 RepID=UPI00356242D1